MDLEKAFGSLDHGFLLYILKKIGFGDNFITRIKILLNDQQSWVINGGFTTQYFTLKKVHAKVILYQHVFLLLFWKCFLLWERGKITQWYRPVWLFLFIYCLCSNLTFFLKQIDSVRILVYTYKVFSCFSGLKRILISVKLLAEESWKEPKRQSVVYKILISPMTQSKY